MFVTLQQPAIIMTTHMTMMKVHKTKRAFSLLSMVDKVPFILRMAVLFADVDIDKSGVGNALVEYVGLAAVEKMLG